MALLGLGMRERMLEYDSIELLPSLEETVLFTDTTIPDLDETFASGMDDWWPAFISDMYL